MRAWIIKEIKMIIQEIIDDNFVKTYSSVGSRIKQVETGIIIESAIDVNPCPYTYEETDEMPIEAEPSAEELLSIITGEQE